MIVAVVMALVMIGIVTWSWPPDGSPELNALTFIFAFYLAYDLRSDRAKKAGI